MYQMFDTVIIGSGLSGSVLGDILHNHGLNTALVEKSKGVGGRLATRRIENNIFDHGCQSIAVDSKTDSYLTKTIYKPEDALIWRKKNNTLQYTYSTGVTSFAKNLTKNLNLFLNEKVVKFSFSDQLWTVECESGFKLRCYRLIFTTPAPQVLEIFKSSHFIFPEILNEISYSKAIVLLVKFKGNTLNTQPSESELSSLGIEEIVDQNTKRTNPSQTYTIFLKEKTSEDLFDETSLNIESFTNDLISKITRFKNISDLSIEIKKWRYATPLNFINLPYLSIENNLYLAGDYFYRNPTKSETIIQSRQPVPTTNSCRSALELSQNIILNHNRNELNSSKYDISLKSIYPNTSKC